MGTRIEYLLLKEKDEFNVSIKEIVERADKCSVVFLCNPNNPTGKVVCRKDLIFLLKKLKNKKIMLILDEAFIELTEENSLVDIAPCSNNLFILRSLTKFFGLPGLRIGYGIGAGKLMDELEKFRQPWPVNIFAQAAGTRLIQDKEFKKKSKELLLKEKQRVIIKRKAKSYY